MQENNDYHIWYSYKTTGNKYKIGYSKSTDLIQRERNDEKVIFSESKISFDDDMQCYPSVFKHNQSYYMLYNGNNFGEDGIGLAVSKKI